MSATVAERTERASATTGTEPESAARRTRRRALPPGGRAGSEASPWARAARPSSLWLAAADGHLVPQAATPTAAPADATAAPPTAATAATTRVPVRLTRRGRIVVTAAAMLAIGVASIAVAGTAGAARAAHSGASATPGSGVTRIEIRAGESLWSVAEAYDPNADTRVVIREILQMNSLTSDQVEPGQVLWVPRE